MMEPTTASAAVSSSSANTRYSILRLSGLGASWGWTSVRAWPNDLRKFSQWTGPNRCAINFLACVKNKTTGLESHLVMGARAVSRLSFNRYPWCFYTKFGRHLGVEFMGLAVHLVYTVLHPTVDRKWTWLIQILCTDRNINTLCMFAPQFHNKTQSGRKF